MDENRQDSSGHPAARDTPAGQDRATGVDDVTPRHEYGDDNEVNHRAAGGGYVEMAVDTVTGNQWGTYAETDPEDAVVDAIESHPERAVPTTFIVTDTATGVESEVQITKALAERVDTQDGSEDSQEPSDAPDTESPDEPHTASQRDLDMFEIERHNETLGGVRARSGKEALRMFIDDFADHQGFIYRVENTDTEDYPTHVFRIEDRGPRIVDVEDDGDVPHNADEVIENSEPDEEDFEVEHRPERINLAEAGDGTPVDAPLTDDEQAVLDNYAAALGGEEGTTVTVTLSSEVEVPVGHDPETYVRGLMDGISTDSPISVVDHELHPDVPELKPEIPNVGDTIEFEMPGTDESRTGTVEEILTDNDEPLVEIIDSELGEYPVHVANITAITEPDDSFRTPEVGDVIIWSTGNTQHESPAKKVETRDDGFYVVTESGDGVPESLVDDIEEGEPDELPDHDVFGDDTGEDDEEGLGELFG